MTFLVIEVVAAPDLFNEVELFQVDSDGHASAEPIPSRLFERADLVYSQVGRDVVLVRKNKHGPVGLMSNGAVSEWLGVKLSLPEAFYAEAILHTSKPLLEIERELSGLSEDSS